MAEVWYSILAGGRYTPMKHSLSFGGTYYDYHYYSFFHRRRHPHVRGYLPLWRTGLQAGMVPVPSVCPAGHRRVLGGQGQRLVLGGQGKLLRGGLFVKCSTRRVYPAIFIMQIILYVYIKKFVFIVPRWSIPKRNKGHNKLYWYVFIKVLTRKGNSSFRTLIFTYQIQYIPQLRKHP